MKIYTKFLLALVLTLQINVFSQIPNAGFENWIDEFTPNNWTANNLPVPGGWITVTRSSNSAMGSFSAQLQIANFGGNPIYPTLSAINFPVTENYGSLMGYYQFQPMQSSEVIYLQAWFWSGGNLTGLGTIDLGTPAASFTQFSFEIEHFGERTVADSGWILIGIVDTSEGPYVSGGIAHIDELSFGPPVGVHPVSSNIPDDFNLTQNYPNPFNPSTKINFSLPEQSYVELIVYDILGNEITKLINDTYSAGEYSVDFISDNLPAGVYLARLSAGKYSNTIKMTLLK